MQDTLSLALGRTCGHRLRRSLETLTEQEKDCRARGWVLTRARGHTHTHRVRTTSKQCRHRLLADAGRLAPPEVGNRPPEALPSRFPPPGQR